MKERLTGAIILVVLIVLLVPELLSGPSRAPQAAAKSSTEEPPLRSYTINLADDSHGNAGSSATSQEPQASGPAQPAPVPESGPATEPSGSGEATGGVLASGTPAQPQEGPPSSTSSSQPRDAEAPPHATAPKPAPPQKPSSGQKPSDLERAGAAASGAWMVQLGVFANRTNADRLAQELREQGFHPLVSENSSGGRMLWRVRAGPAADRAAADQLNARLRAAGHAGSVVPK